MAKQRPHWKRPRITDEEFFELFKNGTYKADLDEGIVYGRDGKPIAIHYGGRQEGKRHFVRLYLEQRIRVIPVSHVIWMLGAGRSIPDGFEIHHKDLDPSHNWWDNLFCLCEPDHKKLHRVGGLIDEEKTEEIPF